MSSVVPPRVLALLKRMPAGAPLNTISPSTTKSRIPPDVSLPIASTRFS
jgi:hypothetical protein